MLGGTGQRVNFTRCQSLVSAWSPGHPRTRVRRRVYSRLLRNLSDAWRVISLRPSLVTGEPLPSARVSEHRQLGSKPALGGGNQSIRNYRPRTRSAAQTVHFAQSKPGCARESVNRWRGPWTIPLRDDRAVHQRTDLVGLGRHRRLVQTAELRSAAVKRSIAPHRC
jgi:hypothetical protein